MNPLDVGYLNAIFAPWIISGSSLKDLRTLQQQLTTKLLLLAPEFPVSTELTLESAFAAVAQLRNAACLDVLAGLNEPRGFACDPDNVLGHARRLGEAWCAHSGIAAMPDEVAVWLMGRLGQNLEVGVATAWAEYLVESRSKMLPIDGNYGPTALRLVEGGLDNLYADVWVVSGPPSSAKQGPDSIAGGAYKALVRRFGEVERGRWKQLLRFDASSPFWPEGVVLEPVHDAYLARCGVWHIEVPWPAGPAGQPMPCRHLLALRNVPSTMFKGQVSEADALRCWLRAVFAALAIVGSWSELASAPRTVRMSLVTMNQLRDRRIEYRLSAVVQECCALLTRSPVVQRLDICFHDPAEQAWLSQNWQEYLRGTAPEDEATLDEAGRLLLRRCCDEAVRLRVERAADSRLVAALGDLLACLETLPHPRATHLGHSARHTVEAIVASLCAKQGKKASDSLMSSIESLTLTSKYSRWFVSYLHTLRTLGNEAVHVSTRETLPRAVESSDHAVLLAALARVLTVTRSALRA
jgi:hypothetical protein